MQLALLAAIVVLALGEMAAVVVLTLWGAHDQTATSIEILIGMIGPIVASLAALVHGSDARAQAAQAQTQAQAAQGQAEAAQHRIDQVEAAAAVPPGAAA